MTYDPRSAPTEEDYRLTFGTAAGRRVLADLLQAFGFWDELVETPENLVLQNAARLLLKRCGILKEINKLEIVDALFTKTATPG